MTHGNTEPSTQARPMLVDDFTHADAASRLYTLTYESASQRGQSAEYRCIALDVAHAQAVIEARLEAQHGPGVLGDQRLMRVDDSAVTRYSWPYQQLAESWAERMERRAVYAARSGERSDMRPLLAAVFASLDKVGRR